MKTTTLGKYLDAKHLMIAEPTMSHILAFVDAAIEYKGRQTIYHYDLANMCLKRCP